MTRQRLQRSCVPPSASSPSAQQHHTAHHIAPHLTCKHTACQDQSYQLPPAAQYQPDHMPPPQTVTRIEAWPHATRSQLLHIATSQLAATPRTLCSCDTPWSTICNAGCNAVWPLWSQLRVSRAGLAHVLLSQRSCTQFHCHRQLHDVGCGCYALQYTRICDNSTDRQQGNNAGHHPCTSSGTLAHCCHIQPVCGGPSPLSFAFTRCACRVMTLLLLKTDVESMHSTTSYASHHVQLQL